MKERLTRVVLYLRVSSTGQEDNSSLDTQEREARSYAAERGWEVVQVYREVHTGAELFERPQMAKLREAMRRREFDVLLVHALDRLSRKQTHQGLILSEAEHAGVLWDSVTEEIDDSPTGQMLRAIIGGMAELERLKIAERTVRGRKDRIQNGKLLPGGRPPYGYRWRDASKGALDLDPETAPIVKGMYEDIAAGRSLRAVVARLHENGVPTATGTGRWHAQTVRDMLLRQQYCGRATAWGWRKRSKGKPQQFDAEKAIPLPEGTIPAIVTEELWEAVQQRLQLNRARATRSAKNPEAALLRGGYVVCGHCGRTLQARPRSDGGVQYVCAHGKRYGDCPGSTISGQKLDGATWSRVRDILQDPDLLRAELERRKDADTTPHQLATAERLLADLERRGANLARGIAQMDDEEAARPLLEELTDLKRSRTKVESEIAEIKAQEARWRDAQLAVRNLADWTRTVGVNLERLTWKERRLVLDALGVRLTVFPHGHEPRYVIDAEIPIEVVSPTTSGTRDCRSFHCWAWRG